MFIAFYVKILLVHLYRQCMSDALFEKLGSIANIYYQSKQRIEHNEVH